MTKSKGQTNDFAAADFLAFTPDKWRNEAYNPDRLVVRRRLLVLGKEIQKALRACGLDLVVKASLHHPYTYNAFCVSTMWAYLSRKNRSGLKSLFGADLGQDLDPAYVQMAFSLAIGAEGVDVGLRIHPGAWWEGQNVKNKVADADEARTLLALLNDLDGYVAIIHDWKKEYVCGSLRRDDVATFFQYYVPGEHWFNVRRRVAKSEPALAEGSGATLPFLIGEFERLVPLYRFIAWSEENDFLDLRSAD